MYWRPCGARARGAPGTAQGHPGWWQAASYGLILGTAAASETPGNTNTAWNITIIHEGIGHIAPMHRADRC